MKATLNNMQAAQSREITRKRQVVKKKKKVIILPLYLTAEIGLQNPIN